MIKISIAPGSLFFVKLSPSVERVVRESYNLQWNGKRHFIKGEPDELYKVLLTLSYTYDIELI